MRNVLALRGDPAEGSRFFCAVDGGFANSGDLVRLRQGPTRLLRGRRRAIPEGHPECLNRTRDLEHLKAKVDAGADAVVTQLFFDNAYFYDWRDRCARMGIDVPITAGIMPILQRGADQAVRDDVRGENSAPAC